MPAVNPKILQWARETAGLSLEDAARAIDLGDTKTLSGAEKLADLESGKTQPTRQQLEKMSKKYRRSLLIFYLSEPPIKGDRGQDFRKLPGESIDDNPNLDALIRNIKTRQSIVKMLLEDEESPALSFVASAKIQQDPQSVADDIVSTIDLNLTEFRNQKSPEDAFKYLRRCMERSGIFVLLVGDLGSYHTDISIENFRGFAIADTIAPFIVINNNDAHIAWAFTALHEIAHIWLGTTGISGQSNEHEIERFCNEVAGRILLPPNELAELDDIQRIDFEEAVSQISEFADLRNISRAMVAFSLLNSGRINPKKWRELINRFDKEWEATKKTQKKSGGPSYYTLQRQKLGDSLIDLVARSINGGILSPTKAAKVLDVSLRNVDNLLNSSRNGGSRNVIPS